MAPLGSGERFRALAGKLEGKVGDPKAVAAAIGRKKYGSAKMARMARLGKLRKMRAKRAA